MKKLAISGALIFALSGFVGSQAIAGEDTAYIDTLQSIIDAKTAIKKAGKAGGAWRDSKKFVAKAEAAARKGDMATARKMADMAKFEGEMGLAQAMSQKTAKPWLF